MPDRAAIRDWVREQTLIESDDWSDDKINNVINQGLRVLATKFKWPWLAASTTLSTVAGTTTYAMPSDLTHTAAITHQTKPQRLVEVAPHQILGPRGGDLPSGAPTSYYIHGSNIYLDKVPTEAATYDWLYFTQVSVLDNDTDVPAFAEEFHLVLADYAIAQAWQREEDFTKADEAMEAFDSGVERMAVYYLDKGRDRPIILGEDRPTTYRTSRNNMPWLDGV